MRGDGSISSRSSQVFSVLVWDVFALTIFVALGKAEVNDVDVITGRLCASNQEIIRLDISMDNSLLMHLLDSLNQLDAN